MPNRKVSIWMYVRIDGRWRYAKPVEGRNHKLKPGWCLVNGVEQHHPNGAYYIRYREVSKTVWRKCRNAADASVARERQEAFLSARVHGLVQQEAKEKLPMMVRGNCGERCRRSTASRRNSARLRRRSSRFRRLWCATGIGCAIYAKQLSARRRNLLGVSQV